VVVLDAATGAMKFPVKQIDVTFNTNIRVRNYSMSISGSYNLWLLISSEQTSSGGSFLDDKGYLINLNLEGDAITVTN
jgi:hypothetical protein